MPLVSVLIPAFNHARFIVECLESVGRDGYPRKEIVLIDDGSSDGTFELARSWLEERQAEFDRVLALRQSNQGVCRTLNSLVSHARGEYVALLASDDALLEGGIASRVRALEENPRWLAVFGDAELMGPAGEHLAASAMVSLYGADKRMLLSPRSMATELLLRWAVPGPVLLLRRAAFHPVSGVGPYAEDLAVEDRDLYLRLVATKRLGFVDQRVARYRLHTSNVSRQADQKPRMARDHLLSCRRNLDRFAGFERLCLALNIGGISQYVRAREGTGIQSMAHRAGYLFLRAVAEATLRLCRLRNAIASPGPAPRVPRAPSDGSEPRG
jgi:glycosyltransferase involved in cell wall biosynthesis